MCDKCDRLLQAINSFKSKLLDNAANWDTPAKATVVSHCITLLDKEISSVSTDNIDSIEEYLV